MYFAVHELDTDGGIMITGSHNPAEDNGLKIMKGKSSFFGAQIQQLQNWVLENHGKAAPSDAQGSVRDESVHDRYLAMLSERVPRVASAIPLVIDAGNGAAGPLGKLAIERLGLAPTALFCDMDGRFPNHHPDPTVPENLVDLRKAVAREGALVGIAWDGDGDRLGVVDKNGDMVWGDRLLSLFARSVLETEPGATVLGDVKCSSTLFRDIEAHGGKGIMWKTGHSLIKAKMKEEGALLAGEMSGHFFFKHRYYGFDDGIYAALRLVEILAKTGKSVGELLADLPRLANTPEIRMACPDAHKATVVDRVREALGTTGELSDIDGVRLTYPDGAWGLVRASNTGPVLVLRFEGPTEERVTELQTRFQSTISDILSTLS
jgi:phosphomannomutase/phosphoglucomutase